MRNISRWLSCAAAILLPSPLLAAGVVGWSDGYFSTVDPATGQVTHVTSVGSIANFASVYDPANRWYYLQGASPNLLRLDAATGAILSDTPMTAYMTGMALDASTQTIYGWSDSYFSALDPTTGQVTHVTSVGGIGNFATVYDPANRWFYLQGASPNLLRVDAATGAILSDTPMTVYMTGMALDASTQTIYGWSDSYFSTLDPTTGQVTQVTNVGDLMNAATVYDPANRWYYLQGAGSNLLCLDVTTGAILSDTPLSDPIAALQIVSAPIAPIPALPSLLLCAQGIVSIIAARRFARTTEPARG